MSTLDGMSFGQRLIHERKWQKLTQDELAKKLNTSNPSVVRWEHGKAHPQPLMERAIYTFFGKTAETFGLQTTRFWHVPIERNPYFVGRDDIFETLHKALATGGSVAITQQALTGLGGIGKTQVAVEYAYRFAPVYSAVLWVRADSPELLASDFASLTTPLHLQENVVMSQEQAIGAVKHWLETQTSWLLIFDNVEDVDVLSKFLPTRRFGSVLITTRVQTKKRHIETLQVEKLTQEQSIHFLFRRAHVLEKTDALESIPETEVRAAKQLCALLDGLPLALEQAAAYIDKNECSIAEYLALFQSYSSSLLDWRSEDEEYPYTVATTWSLSFQKLEKANAASADMLRACAFLHPDAIPEELFLEGGDCLSPYLRATNALELKSVIEPLLSLSLVRREKHNKTLLIHRLVQVVLQEQMSKDAADEWARRVIRAVNTVFPKGDFASWPLCERYFPHVQMCVALVEQKHILIPEAVALFNRAGYYLKERSRFNEASSLLKLVLSMSERLFGSEHLNTADTLHHLAATYRELCRHDEARPLYEKSLTIRQRLLATQHPDIARTFTELADFHAEIKEFLTAEHYYKQAHAIYEATLGAEHLETLRNLNQLSELYFYMGRIDEAEEIAYRILKVQVRTLGVEHPETIVTIHNIGFLYGKRERYEDSLQLLWLTLAIHQRQLGPCHRTVTANIHNLAHINRILRHYSEAEALWKRTLIIRKHILGEDHADTQKVMRLLRELYQEQGIQTEIESRIAEVLAQPLPSQPLEIPIEYVEVVQQFCSNHTYLLESIYRNVDDRRHKCVDHDVADPCESCKSSEHPVVEEPVAMGARYPQ